jgi:GTPase SAR1 family protein
MSISASSKGGVAVSFKVVMLGDQSAGKSCLVSRFVNNKYDDHQAPTLAQDFKAKTVEVNAQGQKAKVRL